MSNQLTAKIGLDVDGVTKGVSESRQTLKELGEQLRDITAKMKEFGSEATKSIDQINVAANKIDKSLEFDVDAGQGFYFIQDAIKNINLEMANLKADNIGKQVAPAVEQIRDHIKGVIYEIEHGKEEMANSSITVEKATESINKRFFGMQREIMKLTEQYRSMSNEERNNANGKALQSKLVNLKSKAAELKDIMADTKMEIKSLASDTGNLDAFNSILGVSNNALSSMASTYALVTGNEKDFQTALAAFTAVQSVSNTLTELGNVINQSNIAILKVKKIQETLVTAAITAKTAAEGKGIVTTKAATAAQWLFNKAANANPYVLLASAIIAVGAAMYGLITYLRDGEEATTEQSDAVKELNDQLKQNAVDARQAQIKFNALQTVWANTKGEQAKTAFLKTYAEQLKATGMEVKNLQQAEKLFATQGIKDFEKYIKAKMQLQAAEAKMNKYVHDLAINQMLAEQIQQKVLANGGKGTIEDLKNLKKYNDQIKLNEKGIQAQAKNMGYYGKQMNKFSANLPTGETEIKQNSPKVNRSSNAKTTAKEMDVVIGQYTQKIEELKKKLLTTSDTNERLKINLDIEMNEQKIEAIKTEMEVLELKAKQAMGVFVSGDEISKLESKINDLENYFGSLGDKGKESFEKVENAAKNLANVMTNEIKPINLKTVLELPKVDDEKIKEIGTKASEDINENYKKQIEQQEEQDKAVQSLADSFDTLGGKINEWAGENTAAGDAMIAVSRMIVFAKQAEALASAIASAASVPWPANIPAIASAVATITSMFASIPKFANGGIFNGGNSYVGDKNLARLNKGEMILNNMQQSRLWRMLDSPMMATPTTTSGNVEFRIQGQQLVGLLKNYDSKMSKIK
jgi:hypothetical protein